MNKQLAENRWNKSSREAAEDVARSIFVLCSIIGASKAKSYVRAVFEIILAIKPNFDV